MVWPAIIAAGVGIGKAVRNAKEKKKAAKRARRLGEQAQSYYEETNPLDPESMQYQPAQFGESQMSQAYADPVAIEAERRALAQLGDIYSQGGYTDIERAQINETLAAARQQEQSQRAAIMQQQAARGMGGSGAEFAGQLSAQQGAANAANIQSGNIAAAGHLRAFDALAASADLAGDIRSQSYDEASRRGQGADRARAYDFDAFNQAAQWNAGTYADAARYNLDRASARADTAMGRSSGEQAREGRAHASQEAQTDRWLDILKSYGEAAQNASGGGTGGGSSGGGAPY